MEQICALLLAEKSHDSKLLVVMKVFQDSYILSCYPLIIITYFYAKMQENFFCCTFLQFWAFLLMFITILVTDHVEIWFYLKYAYFKEHIGAFGKILSFGHQVKTLHLQNFGQLYLLTSDRPHDNLNKICKY